MSDEKQPGQIPPDVTDDAVLGGRLRLLQPRRGHRFGHDAILLAAATRARGGDRIADLGAGVGTAGLAVAARVPGAHVKLVEISAGLATLAALNAARNQLVDRVNAAIDVVAQEYAGKVKVGKLDVDANGNTAMRYNIRGIPTLLLFKGGRVVEQRVGAVGKQEVQKMLDPHVKELKESVA